MSEEFFNGPAGRIHASYHPSQQDPYAPVALVMHPHPLQGGTMNNKISYRLYKIFVELGFSTLRFNFRGCGKSDGKYCGEGGEVADAAAALDWIQHTHQDVREFWVGGFSFGGYIAMQLLMRRPEIRGFIGIAVPANIYDFSFLAPCPRSGLFVSGSDDEVISIDAVDKLAAKLNAQKNVHITNEYIDGANHAFENKMDSLTRIVKDYLINNANICGLYKRTA